MALPDDRRHTLADHSKDVVGEEVVPGHRCGRPGDRPLDMGRHQKGGPSAYSSSAAVSPTRSMRSSLPIRYDSHTRISSPSRARGCSSRPQPGGELPSEGLLDAIELGEPVGAARRGSAIPWQISAELTVRTFVRTFAASHAKRRLAVSIWTLSFQALAA